MLRAQNRSCWLANERFYWENDGLSAKDVLALSTQRERRKKRQLERAHAAMEVEEASVPRREPIPREVRLAVWQRDGGCCVQCGSQFEIQYDHIIPVTMGGATTFENLQILCAECNQSKGGTLG